MKRAIYDKQFKIAVVKLVQNEDYSVTKAANELSISGSSLQPWINEYEEYGESAFPGHGNALLNSTYEIKKLQKANEELKMGNDLLKKPQAFLQQKNVANCNNKLN
jgi:transposase